MAQNNPHFATATTTDSRPAARFSAMLGISDGYLWTLLALLMSVTIFEGYDVTIFHLCTPDIAKSFHLDDRAVGTMASFVRLGGMAAFFIVMLSDRSGRKPIVSMTVMFYAGFTSLHA